MDEQVKMIWIEEHQLLEMQKDLGVQQTRINFLENELDKMDHYTLELTRAKDLLQEVRDGEAINHAITEDLDFRIEEFLEEMKKA